MPLTVFLLGKKRHNAANMKETLGVTDYIVVISSLVISILIGLRFQIGKAKLKTTREYLLASKNAPMLLVVMSTTVTMLSAIVMLGSPAETYRFGPQLSLLSFFPIIGMALAAKIFIPIYFQLKVSSIYEFLELRYGKLTRYSISTVFVCQMVLYSSCVLYAPVLAINAVTGFSFEMAIVLFGAVCTLYCCLFGLAIHQNDHQARRRFVEWAQNEIAVVPDFHKRILFSDEAHFWLNGYVNKQNGRIWSEANPQVYVETPLHPEKLTVWCALWAGGILLQKR
ncbi:sodium-coupled monocarboxylate transporter 1 [Trichonephila clavipes]|nr:sodium-coupled monocarboxylate transporter 1 [Trichonephila clavipes]